MAGEVTAKAQAAIEKALAEIGCKVEADEVDATDDGYEADDVECKDGDFEVTFDKDFNTTSKEKDEY
ncbi:MAG: PepSY domain-containing protein [Terriglobia bacterium]